MHLCICEVSSSIPFRQIGDCLLSIDSLQILLESKAEFSTQNHIKNSVSRSRTKSFTNKLRMKNQTKVPVPVTTSTTTKIESRVFELSSLNCSYYLFFKLCKQMKISHTHEHKSEAVDISESGLQIFYEPPRAAAAAAAATCSPSPISHHRFLRFYSMKLPMPPPLYKTGIARCCRRC